MRKFVILILLVLNNFAGYSQEKNSLGKWQWLIGEWKGEGDGQPGKGSGSFTFLPDLDSKIIVRKNHSEYPATKDKPKIVHDDLMIVYMNSSGGLNKAIYFDNEGHVINYSVRFENNLIVMTSDKMANMPIFRLTYTSLDQKNISVKFEMSQDGEKFNTYTDGKCVRVK
jgi:hypothetical protein